MFLGAAQPVTARDAIAREQRLQNDLAQARAAIANIESGLRANQSRMDRLSRNMDSRTARINQLMMDRSRENNPRRRADLQMQIDDLSRNNRADLQDWSQMNGQNIDRQMALARYERQIHELTQQLNRATAEANQQRRDQREAGGIVGNALNDLFQ